MFQSNLKLSLVTAPSVEPITLAQAKQHLRVDIDDDDDLITDLITSARLICEAQTNRSFVATQWKLTMDYFPPFGSATVDRLPPTILPQSALAWQHYQADTTITLPRAPLITIDSIQYLDQSNVLQTLSSSAYIVSDGTPGQVTPAYGKIFPIVLPVIGAVRITFTAGYGTDASAVPSTAKSAIKLMCSHLYNNREAVADTTMSEVPMAVSALLDQLRFGSYV